MVGGSRVRPSTAKSRTQNRLGLNQTQKEVLDAYNTYNFGSTSRHGYQTNNFYPEPPAIIDRAADTGRVQTP